MTTKLVLSIESMEGATGAPLCGDRCSLPHLDSQLQFVISTQFKSDKSSSFRTSYELLYHTVRSDVSN